MTTLVGEPSQHLLQINQGMLQQPVSDIFRVAGSGAITYTQRGALDQPSIFKEGA